MMATFAPFISLITKGLKTGSSKSFVFTFCARNSILPLKSFSMISLTRSSPKVNSQCAVITSTPSSFEASTISCAFVHRLVALPCQVSPPSSNKQPGREAFKRFTSAAKCANPPTLPYCCAARSKSKYVCACASALPAFKPAYFSKCSPTRCGTLPHMLAMPIFASGSRK